MYGPARLVVLAALPLVFAAEAMETMPTSARKRGLIRASVTVLVYNGRGRF